MTNPANLKRTLGLAECTFFGVGSILGAGIYALIGKVAGHAGNTTWIAFMIASVTALLSAFSYAELVAAFPKAGGEYVYVKNALGKTWGFWLGILISLNGAISGATVSLGFGGYLGGLFGIAPFLGAMTILLLVFLVNLTGIRESSGMNVLFTIVEVSGLILVVYCAASTVGNVDLLEMPPGGFNGLFIGAALSFYAFIGFEDIVKLAEETKDPEKNIPRALFLSCAIVMVFYLVISVLAVNALPFQELAQSQKPLAEIVRLRLGATGVVVISIIALFATGNTVLSNMLSSSRVMFGMGQSHPRIGWFARVASGRRTPVVALAAVAVVMVTFAFIRKIETVALIANFSILITFFLVNVSVIVLRIKKPQMPRPLRIPGSIKNIPIIPVFGLVMTLFLLAYSLAGLFKLV